MEPKLFLKIFFEYIKSKLSILILFFAFSSIFYIVFSLSSLPLNTVIYAFIISLFLLLIAFFIGFFSFYNREKRLLILKNEILLNLDNLPRPKSLIENEYQEMIKLLFSENSNNISKSFSQLQNITDYYSMWVHQIKVPISAMKLVLQTDSSESNETLLGELFKIEQYVDLVLSFLRLESDTTDYVLKRHNLDDIVRQTVRKFSPLFILNKIELNFQPTNKKVLTDEKWLSFALEQIISNSIKYTKKGTVSIYCDKDGSLVIKDTGMGIASGDLPRICEKGFTGFNGRTDKKASGLGLYICKRILSNLSHSIKIESKVDVGTKVILNLDNIDLWTE